MVTRSKLLAQAKSLKLIRLSKLKKAELQALIEGRFKGEVPLKHIRPVAIFKRLLGVKAWKWKVEELQALPGKFLEALCIIMACPKSGTKKVKIERLLQVASVRKALSEYDRPKSHEEALQICQAISSRYSGTELKDFCRQVRTFSPSTKYGRAAALLSWRESAISKGQKAVRDSWKELGVAA